MPALEENGRNGNGGLGTLPVWARAAAIVGIPGTIAMFLVWMGAKEVPRIAAVSDSNRASLTELLARHQDEERRMSDMYRLLQRICSNTSRSADDRQRCFDK